MPYVRPRNQNPAKMGTVWGNAAYRALFRTVLFSSIIVLRAVFRLFGTGFSAFIRSCRAGRKRRPASAVRSATRPGHGAGSWPVSLAAHPPGAQALPHERKRHIPYRGPGSAWFLHTAPSATDGQPPRWRKRKRKNSSTPPFCQVRFSPGRRNREECFRKRLPPALPP